MIVHVALSLVVCYFVSQKKDVLGIVICTICHCIIDFVAPMINGMASEYMGNVLSTEVAYLVIYIFLTVVAVVSVFVIRTIKNKFDRR